MVRITNFDVPRALWDAAQIEAQIIMSDSAKERKTITYFGLASRLQSVAFEADDKRLHDLLDEISRQEYATGRGMLSAVVVRKVEMDPGNGFFKLARALGRSADDRMKFWTEELQFVYDAWSKNPSRK
jgi:hypothetical protein